MRLPQEQVFEFGGTCLLRIEDIDHTRCRPEYTQGIYEDLNWLGFKWSKPVRIQSEHLSEYVTIIDDLSERGLIYRCFKSRKELRTGSILERQICEIEENARVSDGQLFAWRLSMTKARECHRTSLLHRNGPESCLQLVNPFDYGDIVSGPAKISVQAIFIACTHDDALQGVTHVVRGADFIHLTGAQRVLQTLMGWPEPTYHHPTLCLRMMTGKKLAKRNKDTAIRELRAQGLSPSDVLDMASAAAKS